MRGEGGGVGRVFGCDAGFRLSGKETTDCRGVEGGVSRLETAGFGFFVW